MKKVFSALISLILFAMPLHSAVYAFGDVDATFDNDFSQWSRTSGSGTLVREIYNGSSCIYINSPGEQTIYEKKLDEKITADNGIYVLEYDLIIPKIHTGTGKQTIMVEGHTASNVNAFYGLRIDNGALSYYNGTGQYNLSVAYKYGKSSLGRVTLSENTRHRLKTVYNRAKATFTYYLDDTPLFDANGNIAEVAAYEKVVSADISKLIIRARNISDDKMYIDNISLYKTDIDYKDIYFHFENNVSDFSLKSGNGTLNQAETSDGMAMGFGRCAETTYFTHTLASPVTSDRSVYVLGYDLYIGTPDLESEKQTFSVIGLAQNDVNSFYGLRINNHTVYYYNGKGQYDASTAYKNGQPLLLPENSWSHIETVYDRIEGVFSYYINGEPVCSSKGDPLRIKIRGTELDATVNRIAVIYKGAGGDNALVDNMYLRKIPKTTPYKDTSVYNISISDGKDEIDFDNICEKTDIKVKFDYHSDKNFSLIAALYKSDSLTSVTVSRVDVSDMGNISCGSFDVDNSCRADRIKIFAWDKSGSLKPYNAVTKADVPSYIAADTDNTEIANGDFTIWGDELTTADKHGKTGVVLKAPLMSSDEELDNEKKYSSAAGGPEKAYYINFKVNNKAFLFRGDAAVYELEVEYFDKGFGAFTVEYDVLDESLKEGEYAELENTNTWKKHKFILNKPFFTGKDTDFRIATWGEMMRYSNSDVIIGSVKLSDTSRRNRFDISLKGSTIGNIYYTGETPSFAVQLSNRTFYDYGRALGEYDAVLRYTLTDENKNDLKQIKEKTVTVSPDIKIEDTISFNMDKYGLYYIKTELMGEDNGILSTNYTEFSYVNSDKTTVNPDFGTSIQTAIYTVSGAENLAKNAGIGMLRWVRPMTDIMTVSYDENNAWVTPKGWSSDWTKYENLTKDYTILNNLLTQGTIYSDEKVNGYKLRIPYGDKGKQLFAEYCRYFAENAPEGTKYYEIWNEFDSGPGSAFNTNYENWTYYGDLLVMAADAIYEVDPDAEIVAMSARFVNTHKRAISRVKELIASGVAKHELKDYFKNTSIHPYHWSDNPMMFVSSEFINDPSTANVTTLDEHMQLLRDLYDEQGLEDTKIWISEIAWSPHYTSSYSQQAITEKQQGSYLVQSYVMAKKDNLVYKFLPYLFSRQTNVRVDRDKNMGIIKNQYAYNVDVPYAATSAYLAVANMNMLLTGAEYSDYFYFNRERTAAYRFTHRDGDDIAVLWSVYEDGENVKINLGCTSVTVYDEYGNASVMTSDNGIYDFTLTQSTVYVKGNFTKFNKE